MRTDASKRSRGRLTGREPRIVDREGALRDLVATTDDQGVRGGQHLADVDRLTERDPQPVALPHGVMGVAGVRADAGAIDVDDRSRVARVAAALLEQRAVVAERDEADLLALRLVRRRQLELGRDPPDLRLGQVAEREARASQLLLVEHPQEVGLVLVGIRGAEEAPAAVAVLEARVVAGGDRIGSIGGQAAVQQLVELDVLVARLARVGRCAVEIGINERVDHALAELALHVEREERDLDQLRNATRVVGCVRRAARARELVALRQVGVGAHPDADDLVLAPLLGQERRCDGRVDATAHCRDDAAHAGTAVWG